MIHYFFLIPENTLSLDVNAFEKNPSLEVAKKDAESAGKALVSAMVQGFLDVFPKGPVEGLVKVVQGKTWLDIS